MSQSSRPKTTKRGLSALYVSTFLSGAWAMIIPTIPVLAREFEVSAGASAQVITGFAFGKMAGTVVGGVLLDRKGTRFGLIGSAGVASVAAFGAVFTPWFLLLVLLAFAHSGGALSCIPEAPTWLGSPADRKGLKP